MKNVTHKMSGNDFFLSLPFEQSEKILTKNIFNIRMKIKIEYPKLAELIKEIPLKMSSRKDPKMILRHLEEYYEALNSLLKKYILEHRNDLDG